MKKFSKLSKPVALAVCATLATSLLVGCAQTTAKPSTTQGNATTQVATTQKATVNRIESVATTNADNKTPSAPQIASKQGMTTAEGDYSLEKAVEDFAKAYPNDQLLKIALDTDFGNYVYKITGFAPGTEHSMKIAVTDGSVVRTEEEVEHEDKSAKTFTWSQLKVTPAKAVEAALAKAQQALPNGTDYNTIKEWSLDIDDGQLVYDIELSTADLQRDIKVSVDAISGNTLELDD